MSLQCLFQLNSFKLPMIFFQGQDLHQCLVSHGIVFLFTSDCNTCFCWIHTECLPVLHQKSICINMRCVVWFRAFVRLQYENHNVISKELFKRVFCKQSVHVVSGCKSVVLCLSIYMVRRQIFCFCFRAICFFLNDIVTKIKQNLVWLHII